MVTFRRFDPIKHHRRSIRLKNRDYSKPGTYFITICIIDKTIPLSKVIGYQVWLTAVGEVVRHYCNHLPDRFPQIRLGEMIIMPDHMHAIIFVDHCFDEEPPLHESGDETTKGLRSIMTTRRKMTLPKIIGWLKMNSSKEINQLLQRPGQPFWQRNYYENIVRDKKALHAIEWYIRTNPNRWCRDG